MRIVGTTVRVMTPTPQRTGAVMLRRDSRSPLEGMWKAPGGMLKDTEILEEGAGREVMEEVGLRVVEWGPISGHFYYERDGGRVIVLVILALKTEGPPGCNRTLMTT